MGYTKPQSSISLTGSNSNYRGFVISNGDEYISATYTSTSVYSTPSMKRYNATTGAYIGLSSIGSCTSHSTPLYSTYDGTSDGNGNVWTVSYSYRILVKWSVSDAGAWSCQGNYSYSNTYYPMGVDIDEDSGRMFLLMYLHHSQIMTDICTRLIQVILLASTGHGCWGLGSPWEYNTNLLV